MVMHRLEEAEIKPVILGKMARSCCCPTVKLMMCSSKCPTKCSSKCIRVEVEVEVEVYV